MSNEETTGRIPSQLDAVLSAVSPSIELRRHAFALLRDRMGAVEMEFDDDDDILFRYQGIHFMASFDRLDTSYMRVIYLPFHVFADEDELLKGLAAINRVNRSVKVAKVWTLQGREGIRVAASLEGWIVRHEDLNERSMGRMIEILFTAVNEFSASKS